MKIKKVILVFKTHFDIGFTGLAEDVIREYAGEMLDQVLATCRSTEDMGDLRYVWTMPSWPLKVVLDSCEGERKKELERFIRNGQVAWHGLPFTSHVDFCGEEEYLEGLRYGRELCDRYGKEYPLAAKMTDVPGHGRLLPEVLGEAGIPFLHLGCNEFAASPDVPGLFFWEAPSGRRVLTMYDKGGYGSGLEAPDEWEFPVWMALVHTHDNCGPHSASFIRALVKEALEMYPGAEVVCGTMDDFYKELKECDLSSVPVVQEDLADSWIHGIGGYPKEVSEIRSMRHRCTEIQKEFWLGEHEEQEEKAFQGLRDVFYENMNLFGEHTWGADVKTFLGPERVYRKEDFCKARDNSEYLFMEQSWEEQRERVRKCRQVLEQMESMVGGQAEQRLTGEQVQTKELKIHTEDGVSWVENHRYRLEFDGDTGVIGCLYDKKHGCELLKSQGEMGVFSYRYMRHGIQKMTEFLRSYAYRYSAWGIQDNGREGYPECEDRLFLPSFKEVLVKGDRICFCYEGTGVKEFGDAREIQVAMTLPASGEKAFVELKLGGKQETAFLESGSFCMPLGEGDRKYLINKNGSVLNPKKDIRDKANHVYYALEEFAASDDGRVGVCVVPLDTPLLSIGEDGFYQYRHRWQERDEVFYFNLFNNMWGTNFPQWQGGDYEYRFALWGYEMDEQQELFAKSVQLSKASANVVSGLGNRELLERQKAHGMDLPDSLELLNVKKEQQNLILVTRDLSGRAEKVQVQVPGYEIVEVDYYGREQGEGKADVYEFYKLAYGLHLLRLRQKQQ